LPNDGGNGRVILHLSKNRAEKQELETSENMLKLVGARKARRQGESKIAAARCTTHVVEWHDRDLDLHISMTNEIHSIRLELKLLFRRI
jgi:hypothetical protein